MPLRVILDIVLGFNVEITTGLVTLVQKRALLAHDVTRVFYVSRLWDTVLSGSSSNVHSADIILLLLLLFYGNIEMPKSCAVFGCDAAYRRSEAVIYHRFPSDNEERRKWVSLCMRKNINAANARICSLHFRQTDYERNLRYELLGLPVPRNQMQLKPGTLPTLRLPSSEGKPLHVA